MDDYLYAIADQPFAYAGILAVVLAAYLLGARRACIGLADPWFAQQLLTACASSAVLFMWWIGKVSAGTAAYHVVAAMLFYAIAAYRPPRWLAQQVRRRRRRPAWHFGAEHTARLQLAVFLTLVVSQLALWSITGLPVLLASRLDAAATGGGLGVLTRLISVFSTVTIFLTVLRIGQRGRDYSPVRDALIIGVILLMQVANGSKSSIFFTIFYFLSCDWLCSVVSSGHRSVVVSKKLLALTLAAVAMLALVPIIIENLFYSTGLSDSALVQFAFRIVLSGDSYIHFYGENYIAQIGRISPTLLLASDTLGTLRLVPRELLPVHPGILLYQDLFPYSDSIKGPNMRLDIYGLMFGGWFGGLIFVALAACGFRWMRSQVFRARGLATLLVAVHLFLSAPAVFIDPTLASVVLFNAAMCLPLLMLLGRLTRPTSSGRRPAGRLDPVRGQPLVGTAGMVRR